jgi:hypothetical protein
MRGERSSPRIAYLEGTAELMTPSRSHGFIKKSLGRLFEAFADERKVQRSSLAPISIWTCAPGSRLSPTRPERFALSAEFSVAVDQHRTIVVHRISDAGKRFSHGTP